MPLRGPHDPAAEMRPDLIVAPAEIAAGDVVPLTFPRETFRGIHFVLERQVGDGWSLVYHLVAASNPANASFFRPDEEGVGIPDIGVSGPGPDWVPIPPDVEPGAYRICTGNAGDEFCTPITIVAP